MVLNPVHAGLVKKPSDWVWSSAKAHLTGKSDILITNGPLKKIVNKPWEKFLFQDANEDEVVILRKPGPKKKGK